ncbi:ATP-binding protein [Tolumonas osonensis]|uniref:histidine kinase n=1 Tax=Tolumonas osonensis TaxID=675874 RepID=A0A841GPW2_9GAMM|nr:ATP-binding protein [Tolumonas osonensis]MBB6056940.1 signal transduction histidine kinase/CheY-like chemotaxis protein [Tolumonas osonensis]
MPSSYSHRKPLFSGVRGRLLSFNLLVVLLTLVIGVIAVFGFNNAGRLLTDMQESTLSEMNSGMEVGVKTAKVATVAVSLTQVIGAMEYQSESDLLKTAMAALRNSLSKMAAAPLARQQPQLIDRIHQRSNELQDSVRKLLDLTRQRHLERHSLLGVIYQAQSQLDLLAQDDSLGWPGAPEQDVFRNMLAMTLTIPASPDVLSQLVHISLQWQQAIPQAVPARQKILQALCDTLLPVAQLNQQLQNSDLAIAYHTFRIKALVNLLDQDINQYVQLVVDSAGSRAERTHRELQTSTFTIQIFALLAVVITALAGNYIYDNMGVLVSAIADAMTRLTKGERTVQVPALNRQDELGDLARAFNVFANNAASLARVTRLFKEKSIQLETTFLSIRDGFALFDASGALVVSNPQYASLLQLDQIMPGSHFREVLQRLQQSGAQRSDGKPLSPDHLWRAEDNVLTLELQLGGERYVELRLNRLANMSVASMVLDRTDRKTLEAELIHSQKMKAVGHLTGGIAHDFNNLLAVVLGNLELLQTDELEDRTRQRIERAYKAAERGAQLTQRLLAFSRKQALRPRAIDLAELVTSLRELMEHSLPATLRLELDIQPGLRPAWMDANQLENSLLNLVVNARDAMEGRSGAIRLRLFNQHVQRTSGREQDMVTIEVIDQGCGMTPEVLQRVFEPFFTTKAAGKGSGLGLSMVYGFVRQSGGRVQIDTEPQHGTCVRLQLPCAEAEPVALPATSESAPVWADDDMPLVVVLEDQADVRQTLCEYLHSMGCLTMDTDCGEQALSWVRSIPEVQLLISDIVLPGQASGIAVAEQAQQLRPSLKLLLVSGHDFSEQAVSHSWPLLTKPYTRGDLINQLTRLWQKKTT